MLNKGNPPEPNAVDLSAHTLKQLRELQTKTIGEMMQHFDCVEEIGNRRLRKRDAVTLSCLRNAIQEARRKLHAINDEIDVREREVIIFDFARPLQYC